MRLTRRERFMRIPARYSLVGSVSDLTENGFVRSARIETQPTNGEHCHPGTPVKNSSTLTHRRIIAVGQAPLQVLFELRVSLPVSARTRLSFAGRLLARSKTSAIFGDWHIGTTTSSMCFWRFLSSADYLAT